MSERANELPDGWRRDGDGTAFGPDGTEVVRCAGGDFSGMWTVSHPGTWVVPVPRPRWFPSEGEAIARAVELTRPSDPAPDHRDAEIERLRTQVGEQSREIHGLKGELAAKPAAAPLPAEDRERLGRWLRSVVCGFEVDGEWDALSDASREHWRISADRGAYALQPDPARAAAAEKALERERWIEGTEADVFRARSSAGEWAWVVMSQDGDRLAQDAPSFAAAIDAAMEKHPLKREGE